VVYGGVEVEIGFDFRVEEKGDSQVVVGAERGRGRWRWRCAVGPTI
jgi:hypothetical protein